MLITAHQHAQGLIVLRCEDMSAVVLSDTTLRLLHRIACFTDYRTFTIEADHIHDMQSSFFATACGPELGWLSRHCKHYQIDYVNIIL
jgi:hypothetical protein